MWLNLAFLIQIKLDQLKQLELKSMSESVCVFNKCHFDAKFEVIYDSIFFSLSIYCDYSLVRWDWR